MKCSGLEEVVARLRDLQRKIELEIDTVVRLLREDAVIVEEGWRAVLALHTPVRKCDPACAAGHCGACGKPMPCPTLMALDPTPRRSGLRFRPRG